jgi:(E)-4-hydroxy-3-methyl-but-2-enyl pyrophosphate reductase
MRIKVAGTAGFCWGVQRALRKVEEASRSGGRVATLRPVVHNFQIREAVEKQGVRVLERPDQADAESSVVLRPHGALQDDLASLEGRGATVVDATCPHVANTRSLAYRLSEEGWNIVVAGNREHDEVAVILEASRRKSWVVGSADEAASVAAEEPLALVCQSTFGPALFEDIAETLRERFPKLQVHATACGATEDRIEEARRLAEETDVLVVVGAYHAGNARRLAEIGRETGKQTFHVETADDLSVVVVAEQARLQRRHVLLQRFSDDADRAREAAENAGLVEDEASIGVTAGASTPAWVLRSVVVALMEGTGARIEQGLPRDLAEEAAARAPGA